MTYRLTEIDPLKDRNAHRENFKVLGIGEKLRCQACNSIYWRLFYDRAQCMGCKSITRLESEKGGDLRDVTWIKFQVTKYKDGRVRDPLLKRSEFVIFRNMLKSRVGGTEFLIYPQIQGYWYYGKLEAQFKQMTPSQILRFLQNGMAA